MLKYILYQACSVTCDNEHENMHIQLVLNRNWQSSTYMGKKLKILVRGSIHIMILQSVCWWSEVKIINYAASTEIDLKTKFISGNTK